MTRYRLIHFLLTYNKTLRELTCPPEEFTDIKKAVAAYTAKEHEYDHLPDIEVVLLGSDSLDTIKITHANYFEDTIPTTEYFAGLQKQR